QGPEGDPPRRRDPPQRGRQGPARTPGRLTVAKLIYSAIGSLDGFVEDERGKFDWAAPDEEVHAFVNELERPIGTYLYGRRMYEVMVAWETMEGAGALGDERRFAGGVVHLHYRTKRP